jgi:hypothetical protein
MPKKQNKQKTSKTDEDELSELLQESLKKSRERIKKEASEEEIIEEGEEVSSEIDMSALEFHQFLNPGDLESGSPVLERIAGSQTPRPMFVGGIRQSAPTTNGNDSGDELKYVQSINQPGEATYMGSTHVNTEAENVDFSKVGRERSGGWDSMNVSEGRISAREDFGVSTQSFERADRARQFDASQAGRDPANEVKYQKYDPKKLPSGR